MMQRSKNVSSIPGSRCKKFTVVLLWFYKLLALYRSFEKLISGKYLGAITHAALLKLTKDKVLFGGECSDHFGQLVIDRFNSLFLSVIEGEK